MPRKLPLHVERHRDRYGKIRFYFRIGKGPRTLLPNYGSLEFNEVYSQALAGNLVLKQNRRSEERPGSLAALITSYKREGDYVTLRPTTRAGYNNRLEKIRAEHGHRSIAGLTNERIKTGILRPYADRPGAMLDTLKKLRILIRHAVAKGWLTQDPSFGIKRPRIKEIRAWTDAELLAFERRWPMGTKQRLAFALYLYLGQRGGDLHRLTWNQFEGGFLQLTQSKTGTSVVIKIHPDLQEILDVTHREHLTILNTKYGRPFSRKGFGQWFRNAMTEAGLKLDCKPHGIRKTTGRLLAESNAGTHGIMSVLGHKTLAEAERYTRDANKKRMASAAIAKFRRPNENSVSQTTQRNLGKSPKTKGESR